MGRIIALVVFSWLGTPEPQYGDKEGRHPGLLAVRLNGPNHQIIDNASEFYAVHSEAFR